MVPQKPNSERDKMTEEELIKKQSLVNMVTAAGVASLGLIVAYVAGTETLEYLGNLKQTSDFIDHVPSCFRGNHDHCGSLYFCTRV